MSLGFAAVTILVVVCHGFSNVVCNDATIHVAYTGLQCP